MSGRAAADPTTFEPMTHRRIRRLAVPVVAEYTLQVSVVTVNTWLVSAAGDLALAAVGVANPILYILIAMFAAISTGATVLVAHAHGAQRPDRVNEVARQAITWGILLVIPLSAACYWLTPTLVRLFGDDPRVHAEAITYLHVISATVIVLFLSILCGSILRGTSDGRTPLLASILANIGGLVAAWVLIGGNLGVPSYGVAGAAWGSVIGRGVGLAYLLARMITGGTTVSLAGWQGWRPHLPVGRQIFRLGIPAGIEQLSNESGFAVLTMLVAALGASVMAANQIAFTALEIWFLTSLALSITLTALAGQSYGARRPQDALFAARVIRRWTLAWTGFGMVVLAAFPRPVLRLFSDSPDVVEAGVSLMRVIAVLLPCFGMLLVTTGVLRGSGDTRSPMVRSVIATWATVALAFVAVHWFEAGAEWIWGAYLLTIPVASWLNWRAFVRRSSVAMDDLDPEPEVSPLEAAAAT
jgi:multidrug resistance protein, MATE family